MSRLLRVPRIAHVPGVFSHYGPGTGSALVTKVYHHARSLERHGGTAYVMVNEARRVDYESGTAVRFRSAREGRKEWFTTAERRFDGLTGTLVGRRPMIQRFWRPALQAVPADADAVVVYNQPAAVPSRRRPSGQMWVLHLGNDPFRTWRPSHIRSALESFDLTVAVSAFTADAVNRRLPPGSTKVHVLRNGVDLEQFHPGVDGPESGQPEILFVGNMVPHKGAHHLVAAALRLVERRVDFRLRIVGSWGLSDWSELTGYEQELRNLAVPLGDRVIFQPFTDRHSIAQVYRTADIFCMPVEWDEPAGQVVTEAMASGLPVVAAPRGGIPEYLGSDGEYVDPADVNALAAALEGLVRDPSERSAVGRRLRTRAETMSWDARVSQFDVMLDKIRTSREENGA